MIAGRVLVFSDPQTIRLVKENCVPVAVDIWYLLRQKDAGGEFFRSLAKQSPRQDTAQGIYCATAGGKVLSWSMDNRQGDKARAALERGLAAWKKLPESERRPGSVTVAAKEKPDPACSRTLPPNGLVLKVFTRALDRDEKDGFRPVVLKQQYLQGKGHGNEAARDYLWLTEQEWKALLPADAPVGARIPVPASMTRRIFRFHLIDTTQGEPIMWKPGDVRSGELTLTITEASATIVRMRLEGAALLASDADTAKAKRGYDAQLLGYLDYNPTRKRIDRFDVAALGEAWGNQSVTRGYHRPGRTPLGVAFTLAGNDPLAGMVVPEGAKVGLRPYLDADR